MASLALASLAHGQTYWLNSQYDTAGVHYATAEEACISGEVQRRLDIRQSTSPLPHRYTSVNIGADYDIGERVCQAVIQRRQFNQWLPAEIVATTVYGPLGETPDCPLSETADPDTGQCLIPKCDSDCPIDGGNPSNPVASASGNKRQVEADFVGAGIFPLVFTRTYNSGRIADKQQIPLGAGWTHNYAARLVPIVDASGQITRIRAQRPNGAIQTFTLAGGQWQPDADVPERLSVTLSNGLLQAATYRRRDDSVEHYNPHGRLISIQNSDGHEQALQYASGSAQPHTITDPQGRTLHLAYNSAGQLAYTWDATGNRTGYSNSQGSQSYSYPAGSHRLASINATNRSYDARNRLSQVQTNGNNSASYRYNAWGERVWRETPAEKTLSIYLEDGRWLGDYHDASQPIQQIIWLQNHPVAVLDYSGSAHPLHYIESDHLGTPRVVIEQGSNLAVWTWPITGEAFGNTPPDEDPDGDGTHFTLDMRFPGQRYDSASGLYYNYFRDYEPGTGRYIQSDPIGLAGGLATYSYARGNSFEYIDSTGEVAVPVVVLGAGLFTAGCAATPGCREIVENAVSSAA